MLELWVVESFGRLDPVIVKGGYLKNKDQIIREGLFYSEWMNSLSTGKSLWSKTVSMSHQNVLQ